MKPPEPPRLKTPEELAREFEDRVRQEALRTVRWRRRRESYRIATVLTGLLIPTLSLAMAGSVSSGGLAAWIERIGWWPLMVTAIGGTGLATWAFAAGWGVSRGMMAYGGLFMLLVILHQARLGTLIVAMPGLVALFVCGGALVGYLVSLEEGD